MRLLKKCAESVKTGRENLCSFMVHFPPFRHAPPPRLPPAGNNPCWGRKQSVKNRVTSQTFTAGGGGENQKKVTNWCGGMDHPPPPSRQLSIFSPSFPSTPPSPDEVSGAFSDFPTIKRFFLSNTMLARAGDKKQKGEVWSVVRGGFFYLS